MSINEIGEVRRQQVRDAMREVREIMKAIPGANKESVLAALMDIYPNLDENTAREIVKLPPADNFDPQPLDIDELLWENLPPVEYLVWPYLPKAARIWIFGSAETAKSLWAAWNAAELSRRELLVMYISQENPLLEDRRRLEKLNPWGEYLLWYHMTGIDLHRADNSAWLVEEAKKFKADLVIIDGLMACWSGDEDSSTDISLLDQTVLTRLVAQGTSVLIIDHVGHPNQSGGRTGVHKGRGSSRKQQVADVVLNFHKEGEHGRFAIEHAKNRLGGGVHEPLTSFEVVDIEGSLTRLDIVPVERVAQFMQKVEDAVEAIRKNPNGIGTEKLKAELNVSGGDWTGIRKNLEADMRVRVESKGKAKLWFPADDLTGLPDNPI